MELNENEKSSDKENLTSSDEMSIEYDSIKEEHNLPELEKLAEDFDIEKVFEKETNFLAREIRRAMIEKLSAYLNFFETLLNPSSSPMFVFSFLKRLTNGDKDKIKILYKELSLFQVKSMKLDIIYSEKSESEFIKLAFNEWQKMKPKVLKIIEGFDKSLETNESSRKNGYFN